MPTYNPPVNWHDWWNPPVFLGTEEAGTELQRDTVAQLYLINQLLPYMTPRAQADAMKTIMENVGSLGGAGTPAPRPGETAMDTIQQLVQGYGGGVANPQGAYWGGADMDMPAKTDWWTATLGAQNNMGQLGTQATNLSNLFSADPLLASSPYAEALRMLGQMGTNLGTRPTTAAGQRQWEQDRTRALANLENIPGVSGAAMPFLKQLGGWFAQPEYMLPSATPRLGGSSAQSGYRGGGQSWWS